MANGKLLYNVNFKTDSNSLRITPIDINVEKKKFVIFFGCSYTFGDGLESNQTIPFLFQNIEKEFMPYNFGYSAYSPAQMLAKLQEGKINKIVKKKNGIAFYTYIPDHLRRVIDGTGSYTFAGGRTPLFKEENGHLVRDGLISETGFLKSIFYKTVLKSNILNYFKIAYPIRITQTHFKYTAKLIIESSILYKKQFKNDNFYVVFYPTIWENEYDSIIIYLKQSGVKYLDYSKLFNPTDDKYSIPFDGHPTLLANKLLVNQIIKDMEFN